jgi:hypothetical protein
MKNRTIIEGSHTIVNSRTGAGRRRARRRIRASRQFADSILGAIRQHFVARFRSLSHRRCSLSPPRAIVSTSKCIGLDLARMPAPGLQ